MRVFTPLMALLLLFAIPADACTTAVVSGNHTANGRALLWKNRDTGWKDNVVRWFNDGTYSYYGTVNSLDSLGAQVWSGMNSAGFAIMNSASYNIQADDDTTSEMDKEGILMKLALQECATLEDFEELLRELPKPLGVEANFGVIDANGGAAYYETTNFDFVKIDANDPSVAPFGYVIHSNYSFTGDQTEGYGYIRYMNADELFYEAAGMDDLTARFIFQDVTRSLKHSLTETDLTSYEPHAPGKARFVQFNDYIPRRTSVNSTVIEGLLVGEDVEQMVMWTTLGFPLTSVTIPLLNADEPLIPALLAPGDNGFAPLCDMALALKDKCLPIKRGSGQRYLNLTALFNSEGTGIRQLLDPVEETILEKADPLLDQWRRDGLNKAELHRFYDWFDEYVSKEYKTHFNLSY